MSQCPAMQARSALFDLYGDYLRSRGGQAPVSALVKLLAPLGIAAPAVRTAVSRMVRQGWLVPRRLPSGPGYALTPKAVRRLDEAAARVYRTDQPAWDGQFDLIAVVDLPASRPARSRLAGNLAFLGYGTLTDRIWVSPYPSPQVADLLAEAGIRYDRFRAVHTNDGENATSLLERAWDLKGLASAYEQFVRDLTPVVADVPAEGDDEAAYRARFELVHAWRTFLFRDPHLPTTLLPADWPGIAAARFFSRHAGRLRPAADRFVDHCLP